MTAFLSISGLPVEIESAEELEPVAVGEQVTAWDGTMRSTVRDVRRAWQVRTAPLTEAASTQLRSFASRTIMVTVWGDMMEAPTSCLMHIAGADYIPFNLGVLKQLDLIIEEVGTPTNPVADPVRSVASVPNVNVGQVRTTSIQALDQTGAAMTVGGALIAITITGANPGTPSITDHGDGTYTAVDTPAAAGTDSFAMTMNGVRLGSSPYTATVTGTTTLTSIVVTPTPLSLVQGGPSKQLTADPLDNVGGHIGGLTVAWETVSGGSSIVVPTTPGYTSQVSGILAGTDSVRARVGAIISNSVPVTVAAPSGGLWPGEPSYMTPVFDTLWGTVNEGGLNGVTNPGRVTVIDPSAVPAGHGLNSVPFATTKIAQGVCPAGSPAGSAPYLYSKILSGSSYTECYVGQWFQLDPFLDNRSQVTLLNSVSKGLNWIGWGQAMGISNQMYFQYQGGGPGSGITINWVLQGCMKGDGGVTNDMSTSGGTIVRLKSGAARAKWYFAGFWMKMNTAAATFNGEVKLFFGDENGISEVASRTKLGFAGNNTSGTITNNFGAKIDKIMLSPTYVSTPPTEPFNNPVPFYHWYGPIHWSVG